MPFTAKFSERFYAKLGHDVVDELVDWVNRVDLTYRSELRNQNEVNFQRFDARLEQRFAELETKWEIRFGDIEQRLAELDAKWEVRFGAIEGRLTEVGNRLGRIGERFAEFEKRFGRLEDRFGDLERRFGGIEGRFGAVDTRIEAVRADLMKWIFGFWATTILTMIGTGVAVVSLLR